MKCECGSQTEVTDSRYSEKGHHGVPNVIRRRRECRNCKARFTTIEARTYEHIDVKMVGLEEAMDEVLSRITEVELALRVRQIIR